MQTQKDIEALKVKQNIQINKDKYNTDIELKKIDFKRIAPLLKIKYGSVEKQKVEDNKMLIVSLF